MEQLISDYESTLHRYDVKESVIQGEKADLQKQITDRGTEFESMNFFGKLALYSVHAIKDSIDESKIDDLDSKIRGLNRQRALAKKSLVLDAGRLFMLSDPDTNALLEQYEAEHADLNTVYTSIHKVKAAGNEALSALSSASSAISSAQSMEVLDMVTSNKGISVISTLSNSDASSEMSSAKRAIERFNDALDDHQKVMSQFPETLNIELLDLTFDLFLGGAFDLIGSVISMFSLSSAESEVEKAKDEVTKAIKIVEPKYDAAKAAKDDHEKAMLEFKQEQRLMIIPVLAEKGIDISEDFVRAQKDLYAN